MLKKTPLYNLHLELGARMVPFADYLMPVQYPKGTLHEHLHCREQTGFFDISHMGQCLILGEDAVGGLEQLAPGNFSGLKSGWQKYTVLTNANGGVIDDIVVTRIDTGLMIIVNAACKDKDFKYLYNHLSGRCCFNELSGQALFALQGPAAASVMARLSPPAAELLFMQARGTYIDGIKCNISRSGYTGEDGFEISVAKHSAEQLARIILAEKEVEPIGLAARDTLRLEAGLCLYGHEINETITPIEAGLQWLFKKSYSQASGPIDAPFPGADKIIPQLQNGPKRIRVGLLVDGKIPVRDGNVILDSTDNAIGYVTSGGYSPSLGLPIAMALIDTKAAEPGNELYSIVRNRRVTATVTALPFVPHRYRR